MHTVTFLLLILVIAVIAWHLIVSSSADHQSSGVRQLSRDYLQGLNFLLNEEPDKAIDVFIKMLEVDTETVETHLALGNLFRRRGEVNRAIRIHQNVIARPNLDNEMRTEALLALAKDYLAAGVLDRAESLFKELLELKAHVVTSYRSLLDIYQQEKEWQKAIDMAQAFSTEMNVDMQKEIGHYYCELAEIAMEKGSTDQAHKFLKRALTVDKKSARASLLLGGLEYISGRHKHAVRLYKQVKEQDSNYLSESLAPLAEAYQALDDAEAFELYMRKLLQEFPQTPIVLLLSEKIRGWRGDKVAAQFVVDYVHEHPSLAGLHRLIDLRLAVAESSAKEDLLVVRGLTEKLLVHYPNYKCENCGFTSKVMHWLCPGCKQWSTVKSTHIVEES
jgi:lipopolysaccharide biosynthesis regulator YciM